MASDAKLRAHASQTSTDDDDDFTGEIPNVNHVGTKKRTVAVRIALRAIDAASTRQQRCLLKGGGGRLAIIAVPTPGWVDATKQAIAGITSGAEIHTATPGRKGSKIELPPMGIAESIAGGRDVVVITSAPEALLAPETLAAADLRLDIGRLTAPLVRAVILEITGRKARDLAQRDLVGLDLPDVVAALRDGSTARDCVTRLRRASMHKTTLADRPDVPMVGDLVGYGAAGEWAEQIVEDAHRLQNGEEVPHIESALLYGPPGTGKTRLAASIAKSAGLPFLSTSVASWFAQSDGHLGDVVKAMDAFFDALTAAAPAIGFIDEIDALPDRATMSRQGRDWWTTIVTGTLLHIDTIRRLSPPVLLIGATNDINHVDAALKRPGRFDRLILIEPPDEDGLAAILSQLLGDARLTSEEVQTIARLGAGATGAVAKGWVDAARRRARTAGREIGFIDLVGEVMPDDDRPAAQLHTVAIHEAGHAVVATALGQRVRQIGILARGISGGMTSVHEDHASPRRAEVDAAVCVALGGRAADEVVGEGADAGAVSDLATATRLAAAAHLVIGLKGTLTHVGDDRDVTRVLLTDRRLADLVEADLQTALGHARTIIEVNRAVVVEIAEALVHRRVLVGEDLKAILAKVTAPKSPKSPPRSERRPQPPNAVI